MASNRLERYLSSLGAEVPLDRDKYQEGGEHERFCLFCGNPHNNIPVFKYDILRTARRDVQGVAQCQNCYSDSLEMVEANYPDLMEMDEAEGINKRNWENSLRKDDLRHKAETQARINLYNTFHRFDETVERNYAHLQPTFDPMIGRHDPMACYFCKGEIRTKPLKLIVPVYHNAPGLTGGVVHACADCSHELIGQEGDPSVAGQRCIKCAVDYRIDEAEYSTRELTRSLGRHYCPRCAYEEISMLEQIKDGSLLFSKINAPPRKGAVMRFLTQSCDFCKSEFMLDLTIKHDTLRSSHLAKGGKKRCDACRLLGTTNDNGNKMTFQFGDTSLHVVLTKRGKYWTYCIMKLDGKDAKVLVVSDEKCEQDIADCVVVANEACQNLLEEPSQIEFQYGETNNET